MMRVMENWAERHTMISMVLLHIAVGVGFLGAVSGIALAGGSVIWLAYQLPF